MLELFLINEKSLIPISYETKRLELEKWLARMEARAERMGSVATTADVLEAQQKEQKVSSRNGRILLLIICCYFLFTFPYSLSTPSCIKISNNLNFSMLWRKNWLLFIHQMTLRVSRRWRKLLIKGEYDAEKC